MKPFAELWSLLEQTRSAGGQARLLETHLRQVPTADAAWAVHLLSGQKPRRAASPQEVERWAREHLRLPDWLWEQSRKAVDDLAETLALLSAGVESALPGPPAAQEQLSLLDAECAPATPGPGLSSWIEQGLLPLRTLDAEPKRHRVLDAWSRLHGNEQLLWTQWVCGSFRTPLVPEALITALAGFSGLPPSVIAGRLETSPEPTVAAFERLVSTEVREADACPPLPFSRSRPLLLEEPSGLGPVGEWLIEWTWGGEQAQLVRRRRRTDLWAQDGRLLNSTHPGILEAAQGLPEGTVLEGELRGETFVAGDLLEAGGLSLQGLPLSGRHVQLQALTAGTQLRAQPALTAASWAEVGALHEQCRNHGAEGLTLRRLAAMLGEAASSRDFWHWKARALSVRAVLLYFQPGAGPDGGPEFTFAVASENPGDWGPVARTGVGLTQPALAELERWCKAHIRERFGPVRSVEPARVFELGFSAVAPSPRHRSGLQLKEPRILRERADLRPSQIDSIQRLRSYLPASP